MALPDLQTVDLPDGQISYREAGSGPSIVFLHGLAGNSRSWDAQFDHFSKSNHVIAWDAPGYGRSDDMEADIDVYTDCLNQLLSTLIDDEFFLVGHSMGGVLAGRYASRFPEQLAGLVLSCTHVGGGCEKGLALPENYQNRVKDLETMTTEDYGLSRAKAMLGPNTPPDIFNYAADIASDTLIDGLENAIRVMIEADNTDGLSRLDLPTLVISGGVDPVVSKDKTDLLHQLISGSKTEIIVGAGHGPYLEKSDIYNSMISDFFEEL